MNGKTAQLVRDRTYSRHPLKSGRVWYIRSYTVASAGTGLTQPTYTATDTRIYPVEEEVGEREAEYVGQNVMAGDIKLRLPGTVAVTESTVLVCDGETANIKRLDTIYNRELVQEYRLYVDRRFAA